MCGIFGVVSLNNKFNCKDKIKFDSSLDVSSHRGPDGYGAKCYNYELKNENIENFNIYLGHRRLAIIDLSDEAGQPFETDKFTIIYNGEIFNYIELKKELEIKGYSFKTNSDTEVIIKIYEEYGVKGFSQFNGMWAFILYDKIKNIIVVSRDRFSIKPLHYYINNTTYYFASEIKQLLPIVDNLEINMKLMFNFIDRSVTDYNDETFIKNIKRIPAKSNLIINLNTKETKFEKYWDYELYSISGNTNIFEEFYQLFYDSIKLRLRSDVEVGALLSGGLDSSAISVIADKIFQNNLKTFSVVSQNKKYSEEPFIDILIKKNKLKNEKLYITNNEVLNQLNNVIYQQDEPFGSFSILAQNLIFNKIKDKNIKVVLSGQGGDEVLLGYLKYYFFYLKDLLKKKNIISFTKELLGSIINRTVIFQFNLSLAGRYLKNTKNKDFLLLNYEPEKTWEFKEINERQILDLDNYSVPNMARFEDRNSMQYSIETRLPFLDHRLVNFLLAVSTDYKIKNGWSKYLLRESITELPKEIKYRRDKRSFLIPEVYWLKTDMKEVIFKNFKNSFLSDIGVINKDKFLKFYERFLNGDKGIFYSDISRVLIAELWAKKIICKKVV
jgi:asparagine synthase (glutamine-hydrolysing)